MDAFGALGIGRSMAAARLRRPASALLLCIAAFSAFGADEQTGEIVLAQAFVRPYERQPQMEVSATSLPRFDGIDGVTRSSRIDMTLLPTRQSTLGPSLAMTSPDTRGLPNARPFANNATSVDLGLHWRYTSDSNYRFDVSAWRRFSPPDAASLIESRDPSYGARVEMHMASTPRSGFVADHRFLGLQLESGARITVRKSGGKPMVYYRTNF
jgi:hypothetical protein